MHETKLEQWKEDYIKNIEDFYVFWRQGQRHNPANYPDNLMSGDWNGEFDLYKKGFKTDQSN
jgi:hypothetical protein